MAVAIAVPFVLTLFFRKAGILTKAEDEKLQAAQEVASTPSTVADTPIQLISPLTGRSKRLITSYRSSIFIWCDGKRNCN